MNKRVFLAGATGDLGQRILRQLHSMGAQVNCLIRSNASADIRQRLSVFANRLREADFSDNSSLAKACEGSDVIVSAVAGLRPVLIDFQTSLVQAAVAAAVPRFIPSDYSIDYRFIPKDENRNLNLREEFRLMLDGIPSIRVTSVLSGAFMDLLLGKAPFIIFPLKRILCWGDPDQLMDFTTIDDTATVTAYAALDDDAPRYLKIAGDELSARILANLMSEISGHRYRIFNPGGPKTLMGLIKIFKALSPGKDVLYPAWQGMQYMHNMYIGNSKFQSLDNGRYPVVFRDARSLLSDFLAGSWKANS